MGFWEIFTEFIDTKMSCGVTIKTLRFEYASIQILIIFVKMFINKFLYYITNIMNY